MKRALKRAQSAVTDSGGGSVQPPAPKRATTAPAKTEPSPSTSIEPKINDDDVDRSGKG